MQSASGVIDVLVDDEAQAVAVARQYLSYFQGATSAWQATDALLLRDVLPENRARSYDMRAVLQLVADTGSLLELRTGFGLGIFTALARIEGRPVGLIDSDLRYVEQVRRLIRVQIGAAATERAWASGATMTLAEALDLAAQSLQPPA